MIEPLDIKNPTKVNPVLTIYKELLNRGKQTDIGSRSKDIDLTKTSYNLDFKVSTYQTRCENVYFNISFYDYQKKEETEAGYFYIKNFTGEITSKELEALADIIAIGNELTTRIYNEYA